MMFFGERTEEQATKRKGFFERMADRRRKKRDEAEDEKIKECFKYLLPRSFPADAVSMVKNQVAMIISDLALAPEITAEAPGLVGQYAQIEQALAVIISKLIAADQLHDQAIDTAEARRISARCGEELEDVQAYKCPHGFTDESSCPVCGH